MKFMLLSISTVQEIWDTQSKVTRQWKKYVQRWDKNKEEATPKTGIVTLVKKLHSHGRFLLLSEGHQQSHSQTIFRYLEEKYVWWSAYSILVLVHWNVGALFYFNLTYDVTQDYIPKVLNGRQELGCWWNNSSCLFELPYVFPWEWGRVSATLSFLMFKVTMTWKTAFSISVLSQTLQSSKTKHHLYT